MLICVCICICLYIMCSWKNYLLASPLPFCDKIINEIMINRYFHFDFDKADGENEGTWLFYLTVRRLWWLQALFILLWERRTELPNESIVIYQWSLPLDWIRGDCLLHHPVRKSTEIYWKELWFSTRQHGAAQISPNWCRTQGDFLLYGWSVSWHSLEDTCSLLLLLLLRRADPPNPCLR